MFKQSYSLPTAALGHRARILLVDDEPFVTRGLSRGLLGLSPDLEVYAADGANEALEFLKTMPVDVLVTDLHMPGIHGAKLLDEVRKRYPSILRFVLSGEAKPHIFMDAATLALQCLTKPCEATVLLHVINEAMEDIAEVRDERVKRTLSNLVELPARSDAHAEVLRLLSDEKVDMTVVAAAIKNDPAIVLRVLKVANSPFYGYAGRIESLEDAVALIGMEAVVNMVAVHRLFQASLPPSDSRLDFEALWQHSAQVAGFCRTLAPKLRVAASVQRECITGGLLHDIGKLILALASPEGYSLALARMRSERIPLWQSEYEVFGNHHAEIGACLLNLWGLPKSVVSAVAFHHTPHRIDDSGAGAATLIHVADFLSHQGAVDSLALQLDATHLKTLGLPERLADWLALLPSGH